MATVTVTLKHTPKPDDDVAFVEFEGDPKGLAVHFGHGRVWIEPEDLSSNPSLTPAEAIALARALVLVAGCAAPHWRGHHWEAREQNGRPLATTPLGEWYFNQDDCLKAIWTMFGTESVVLLDDQCHGNVTVREPQPVSVKALDEIRTVATNWATQGTDYDEDTEQQIDDGRAILRILKSHDDTAEADDNIGANYCPDSSLLNYAAAHLAADDTPEVGQ